MADANASPEPQWATTQGISYVPLADRGKITDPAVRRLLSRREGYATDCEWLALTRQSYIGGREWFTALNLPPHLLEMRTHQQAHREELLAANEPATIQSAGASKYQTRSEYDLRKSQAFRLNVTREIVEPLIGMLRQHPAKPAVPPVPGLDEFNKEADLARSMSLEDLLNRGVEWAAVQGIYYIGVDSSLTPDELNASLAASGVTPDAAGRVPASLVPYGQPHAWLIDPTCILDGWHDEDGMFAELLVAEQRHNGRQLGQGSGFETVYRYWTRTTWQVWRLVRKTKTGGELVAQLIDEGPNSIGMIPVFAINIWAQPGKPWRGRSLVEDAVLVDRALAGLASSLFFGLENDSDTQVMASTDMSGFDDPDDPKLHAFMSMMRETLRARYGVHHKAVTMQVLNKGNEQQGRMLETYTEMLKMQLRLVGLADKIDDPSQESGIARLRRFQILNSLLSTMAEARARAHRDVLHAAALFLGDNGQSVTRDTIVAPKHFDVKTITDLLLLWREFQASDGPAVPTGWKKKLLGEIWGQYFGDKSEEWMAESMAELDEWNPESAEEIIAALDKAGRESEAEP